MKIKIRFIGPFSYIIGSREVELAAEEGLTLKQLFVKLDMELGQRFSKNITRQLAIHQELQQLILVNGILISSKGGLETRLNDGDVISFVPPMEGG